MGQISKTTNPTGLKQIDRKHFVARVKDDGPKGRVFWLEKFDFEAARIDPGVRMACVAHAGATEAYFDLGAVSDFEKSPLSLEGIATDKPLKFRFIFNKPGESLLVGYADGVRAIDEAGNLGSSLVDIEPRKLDGVAWKLVLPEGAGTGDKPNVLVEMSLFPNAASAVNHPWFGVLVMPEVMRQIAMAIAGDADALDDPESWIEPWGAFISAIGVDPPVASDEDDVAARQDWADRVVERFAAKGIYKHHLARVMAEMDGAQS